MEFHGAGITQIAAWPIGGKEEGWAPGFSVIGAEPRLVPAKWAAVAITHEESPVAQPQKMWGQTLHAEPMGTAPCADTVVGLGSQSGSGIVSPFLPDVNDKRAIRGFHGMQFLITTAAITAGACRDLCEPLLGDAIIA